MKDHYRYKLSFFLLSFVPLLFCTNSVKNMHPERVTWPFHDLLTGVQYPDALLGLEPAVDMDTAQASGHIGFSLVLKNRNNSAVSIPNPIDFVQYMLLDARGMPFPAPPVPARAKLSPEDWDDWENPYCPLVEVLKNETTLPLTETRRLKSIDLDASDSYTFSFQIKGTPAASAGNGQTGITPLPPGRYSLLVTYSLFLSTQPPSPNRLLQTEKIPLQVQ